MSTADEQDAEAMRQNRRANRRVLAVVALTTLAIIGWNLYAQLARR